MKCKQKRVAAGIKGYYLKERSTKIYYVVNKSLSNHIMFADPIAARNDKKSQKVSANVLSTRSLLFEFVKSTEM
jgi:hypothetical protein